MTKTKNWTSLVIYILEGFKHWIDRNKQNRIIRNLFSLFTSNMTIQPIKTNYNKPLHILIFNTLWLCFDDPPLHIMLMKHMESLGTMLPCIVTIYGSVTYLFDFIDSSMITDVLYSLNYNNDIFYNNFNQLLLNFMNLNKRL